MNCPICGQDLTILDIVSATEHVNTCVEHGPSLLEIDHSGQVVVKKNLPPGKQRKICPICDKTFQNITMHFKTCALKHDVLPDLMIQYWDNINSDSKKPKKFPRDLLISFISKCIKEGRVGEQVDYAKALVLSLGDGDPEASNELPNDISQDSNSMSDHPELTTSSSSSSTNTNINNNRLQRDITQELMLNARTNQVNERPNNSRRIAAPQPKRKFPIEFVSDHMKKSNIALRIDRELAVARNYRYKETIRERRRDIVAKTDHDNVVQILEDDNKGDDDDDECMIVQDNSSICDATTSHSHVTTTKGSNNCSVDLDKLFFLARLKDCNDSKLCQQASCHDHDLRLVLEDFKTYSGKSMDAAPAIHPDSNQLPTIACNNESTESKDNQLASS